MRVKTVLILLVIVLIGCHSDKKSKEINTPVVIDLVAAFEIKDKLQLSTIATSVEYLTLESSREAILGGGASVLVTDSIIVSLGFKKIDVFERASGNYIREIGKCGRGPNEYSSVQHVGGFDEETRTIRTRDWDHMIEYRLDGTVKKRFEKPEDLRNANHFENSIYAGYFMNRRGNEKRKIGLYDIEKGKYIKIFPNYQECKLKKSSGISGFEGWFYWFNKELLFKETFNDTVFTITTNELVPKYVFNAGKYKPPYRIKEFYENYFTVHALVESQKYLFFKFIHKRTGYCAVYDKNTKVCSISDSDYPITTLSASKINAFENDIDGFVPFYPMSINAKSELISAIPAYELRRWFDENPEKAAQLPPHLQKLKNIKETDNPVVMIAKLKE